jgi:hypothetical protein
MVPLVVGALLLAAAPTVFASTWGGHNGLVYLSFSDGQDLVSVQEVAPDSTGTVMVDLYAVLADVEPTVFKGGLFAGVGGYELKLVVEGAEAILAEENLPAGGFNVNPRHGEYQVGLPHGLLFSDGRVTLLHWRILFIGGPKQVCFRLDPAALRSCHTLPGCEDNNTQVLYSGTAEHEQHGVIFSAGYVPAYLNWEGEPDVTPVIGTHSWRDTGLFREPTADDKVPESMHKH